MAAKWMRRTALIAACASTVLLAACGSSTIESALRPDRFIAFGDAFSDVGQNGSRYSVNNGAVNNWALQMTTRYGKALAPVSTSGLSYAVGNARVTAKPDAAGNTGTLTITEQIDRFLATGRLGPNDVVVLNGGLSDVIAGMAAVTAGTQTPEAMVAGSRKAGQELGAQIRRLVQAGAKYVVVAGTYDLGRTPWAKSIGRESLLSDASSRFNEGLLIEIVDLGSNVLYVDAAYYVNLFTSVPGTYGFSNEKDPVCTSVDATNGIGIGAGQVNAALCTSATLRPGVNPDSYVFADSVHLAPYAQRQFGDYAYDRLRLRW